MDGHILCAFGHHGTTCCDCDMLGVTTRTLLHEPGQATTTSGNIHKCCIKNWIIYKLDPALPNMSQHADDTNTSTQHCWAQQWRFWPHRLLQGRRFTLASSHLTSRTRKKKMLLVFLLMLHDVCSSHDRVLVLTDEFAQPHA